MKKQSATVLHTLKAKPSTANARTFQFPGGQMLIWKHESRAFIIAEFGARKITIPYSDMKERDKAFEGFDRHNAAELVRGINNQ